MATYVLSNEAVEDLTGISHYIGARNRPAAIKMVDRIEVVCQMLAENPGVGEVRKGFGIPGCRSFAVNRYVIFFRATAGGVEIARILDGSRDL